MCSRAENWSAIVLLSGFGHGDAIVIEGCPPGLHVFQTSRMFPHVGTCHIMRYSVAIRKGIRALTSTINEPSGIPASTVGKSVPRLGARMGVDQAEMGRDEPRLVGVPTGADVPERSKVRGHDPDPTSFASKGSGVRIPSSPPQVRGRFPVGKRPLSLDRCPILGADWEWTLKISASPRASRDLSGRAEAPSADGPNRST